MTKWLCMPVFVNKNKTRCAVLFKLDADIQALKVNIPTKKHPKAFLTALPF